MLNEVDRNENGRLAAVSSFLEPIGVEGLQYFDRCNEICYDLDEQEKVCLVFA
jgi:hypothetical protein